jgi:4-amino-4-deoxy-L-arabinose transferase-like glycosyltransferase
MALATVILHAIVGNRYGFHMDELATLDDARHLAWGYPAYPPVTPFFGRISLVLFGTSLIGFRFFASLVHGATVLLAGLMAREMGGRRAAQFLAGAASLPFAIGGGALMQYVSFDYFAWVLTAYFLVRLLASGDPRWWLAVGASIGFGALSKYTIAFFVAGIVAGVLATGARRYLKSKWLWIGVALSILMFLPNLLWEAQNHFVSLDLLKFIHARDVANGKTASFLHDQLTGTFLPLVLAGLGFCFFSRQGKPFRMVGWMYAVTLGLFLVAKGRTYYMCPAYPMLYAGGAVWMEGWLAAIGWRRAVAIWGIAWAIIAHGAIFTTVYYLPIAPVNSHWWEKASALQETYIGEIGWPELVQETARIRDSLSAEQRAHLGILAGGYGATGAVNLFGAQYGLPRAISGINSYWQRGYGDPPPETLIVMGLKRQFADESFEGCRVAGHIWNRYGVKTPDMAWNPEIYVCGPPRQGWPAFWEHFRYFG